MKSSPWISGPVVFTYNPLCFQKSSWLIDMYTGRIQFETFKKCSRSSTGLWVCQEKNGFLSLFVFLSLLCLHVLNSGKKMNKIKTKLFHNDVQGWSHDPIQRSNVCDNEQYLTKVFHLKIWKKLTASKSRLETFRICGLWTEKFRHHYTRRSMFVYFCLVSGGCHPMSRNRPSSLHEFEQHWMRQDRAFSNSSTEQSLKRDDFLTSESFKTVAQEFGTNEAFSWLSESLEELNEVIACFKRCPVLPRSIFKWKPHFYQTMRSRPQTFLR